MARYHVETYGCTSNRGESRQIERRLRDAGHRPTDLDDADVAILNTCTVVEKTERNMLARAAELADAVPELVITGCMALAQGEAFAGAGIDARVCHWEEVPAAVRNGECPTPGAAPGASTEDSAATAATGGSSAAAREATAPHPAAETSGDGGTVAAGGDGALAARSTGADERADRSADAVTAGPVLDGVVGILPIARGCASNCSYCITKQATGRIDSPPVAENVGKARELLDAGARELRVTGQDTGVYGWDTGERTLPELLERICALDGDFRVRVGMANPGGVHGIREELAAVFAEHDELYNFLHAPVQSGSDAVLGDMRRQHRTEMVRELYETFEETLEHWTFATDFIAGFPTEEDADHERSMALLRELRPERVNVTRFSKRPGTDAADMDGLGGQTKKDRSSALAAAKMEILREVYGAMVGERHRVLAVEEGTGDSVKCRDGAYRQLIVRDAPAHGVEVGEFYEVEVTSAETVYAFCEPV